MSKGRAFVEDDSSIVGWGERYFILWRKTTPEIIHDMPITQAIHFFVVFGDHGIWMVHETVIAKHLQRA